VALDASFDLEVPDGDSGVKTEHVALRNAMNEVTRGAYVKDCDIGVKRWNRLIAKAGFTTELRLPSPRFRRSIGAWGGHSVDPAGTPIPAAEWQRRKDAFLPSESDRAFVRSLMQRVVEPGKMASWIAPPDRGINNLPSSTSTSTCRPLRSS